MLNRPRQRTLITGGTGFIGSHQAVCLIEAGHDVAIVDNLSNSRPETLDRIERITGTRPAFWPFDVTEPDAVDAVIDDFQPDSILHFAGRKHVGESMMIPRDYYDTNVGGLLTLLKVMSRRHIRRLVFSSSGSVYGPADVLPIDEEQPHRPTNPYSWTKSMCERILRDLCAADPSWSIIALRYFNPAGAHQSGLLGEWALGPPSNLMPALVEAAWSGAPVTVHGNDYDTPDGTGVRDYVHVDDVAEAHRRALEVIDAGIADGDGSIGTGFEAINIGRGLGVSVLELVEAMERASGRPISVEYGPRRPGDTATLFGDTTRATTILGVIDYRTLDDMCRDAWRYLVANPGADIDAERPKQYGRSSRDTAAFI